MTPQDPRHGTPSGHYAGCRETCCRLARNADEARRRKYREVLGVTRTVPATGTIRRIQALWALGWTSRHIADWCGWTTPQAVTELTLRGTVYATTAETIRRVYEQHEMALGPSIKNRRNAEQKGWVAPLGWDDIDTDPEPARADDTSDYDEAVVLRALAGEWGLAVEHADRAEVARRWVASGRTAYALWQITRWKVERYFTVKETA